MQAAEFSRGELPNKRYVLGLTMAVGNQAALMSELRLVKKAILDWSRSCGNACERIMFTFVCEPSLHAMIRETMQYVYSEEVVLSPLLKKLVCHVAFVSRGEKPDAEFILGASQ
jgi:hypothetical protein